jgi:hypothetical protein
LILLNKGLIGASFLESLTGGIKTDKGDTVSVVCPTFDLRLYRLFF